MTLKKSEVRPDLRSGPCEKCGENITEKENHILTFFRGRFIILHNRCGDFIDNYNKVEIIKENLL